MKNLVFLTILALVGAIIYTVMVDDAPWQNLKRSAQQEKGTSLGRVVKSGREVGTNTAEAMERVDLARKE